MPHQAVVLTQSVLPAVLHTVRLVSSGVIQPEPNDPSGEALESDKNSMPFSRQCHRSFHIGTSP